MSDDHRLLHLTDKDIFLLKIFEAVVRAGGYAAAEACLNKSKSAISIHILALETRLGKPLCHRGRSGFSLTPEGEQVYEICKDMFSDIEKYRERLNCVSPLVGGALSVAIEDSVFGRMHVLESVLENFNRNAEPAFLEIAVVSPERLLQMLLEGTVDIGIGALPREIADAKMHLLYEEKLALYCSDKHPLYAKNDAAISDEELKRYEAVDLWAYQAPNVEDKMNTLRVTARSSQTMARLLLILSGKCIGLLPKAFAESWLAMGRLKELRSNEIAVNQKCYATVRSGIASHSLCKQMVSELKRAFAADEKAVLEVH